MIQTTFHTNNHHGIQNAPVLISIKSETPNKISVSPAHNKIFPYLSESTLDKTSEIIPKLIQKIPSNKLNVSNSIIIYKYYTP